MATITGVGKTDFGFESAAAGASFTVNLDGDTTGTLDSGSDGEAVDSTTFTSPTASFDVAHTGATIVIDGTSYIIAQVLDSTNVIISGGTITGSGLDWSIPTFSSASAIFDSSLIGQTIVIDDVIFTILDVIDINTLVVGDNILVSDTGQSWSIPSLNDDPSDEDILGQTFLDLTTVSPVRTNPDETPFYSGKSMAMHVFDDVADSESPPPDYRTEGLLLSPTLEPPTTGGEYDPSTDTLDSPGITGRSRAIRQTINAPDLFDELLARVWDNPQIHGFSKAIHVRLLNREPEPLDVLPDFLQDTGYESKIFDDYDRGDGECDVGLWTKMVKDPITAGTWDISLPLVPGGIQAGDMIFVHWTHSPVPDGPTWTPIDMPFVTQYATSLRKIKDGGGGEFWLFSELASHAIPGSPVFGRYLTVTASMDFIGQIAPDIQLFADSTETTKVAYVSGVLRGSSGAPGFGNLPSVAAFNDPVLSIAVNDDDIKGGDDYLFFSFASLQGNDDFIGGSGINDGSPLLLGQNLAAPVIALSGGTFEIEQLNPTPDASHPAFGLVSFGTSDDVGPFGEWSGISKVAGWNVDDATASWGIQITCDLGEEDVNMPPAHQIGDVVMLFIPQIHETAVNDPDELLQPLDVVTLKLGNETQYGSDAHSADAMFFRVIDGTEPSSWNIGRIKSIGTNASDFAQHWAVLPAANAPLIVGNGAQIIAPDVSDLQSPSVTMTSPLSTMSQQQLVTFRHNADTGDEIVAPVGFSSIGVGRLTIPFKTYIYGCFKRVAILPPSGFVGPVSGFISNGSAGYTSGSSIYGVS